MLFLIKLALPALLAMACAPCIGADRGDAAHLFAYYPKADMQVQFDEGYRTHLRWHRAHHDPLVWYGWYVYDGERAGMFIDGSFGAPFAAFDHRVDPSGDGADAAKHFSPYAAPAFRTSYRLRRDLSTGFPLEQWKPSKNVQAFHYTLRSGTSRRFERAVAAARGALLQSDSAPVHTWYELVTGGKTPGYLLLVARDGWKSHDSTGEGLEALVARSEDADRVQGLLGDLADSVMEVKAETWDYREDLSLIPGN